MLCLGSVCPAPSAPTAGSDPGTEPEKQSGLKARSITMHVTNADLLDHAQGTVKFILNDSGIVFFPATQQHRDLKSHGLSYEDDYRGNAVAGLVMPDRVEIRFHKAFSDDRLRTLWRKVLAMPELAKTRFGQLYYQGREIK
ncbi:MAG: hypothetical protein P4N60_24510 [Verrucomicrobiae bacterium]|nr:hypothetical protein [Verrucomicrobiae bacterium]